MGVSDALKPRGVTIQALEPAGSAAIGGGTRGPFAMQGWAGFVVPHWNPERVDHVEAIGDDEAIEMTSRLAREDGVFAGISTGANVVGAHRLAARLGPDRFEFQMLFGVRRDLQASLRAEGFGMRVYIPYGREWFPYFMRRLGERPANVGFVLKSLVREC